MSERRSREKIFQRTSLKHANAVGASKNLFKEVNEKIPLDKIWTNRLTDMDTNTDKTRQDNTKMNFYSRFRWEKRLFSPSMSWYK